MLFEQKYGKIQENHTYSKLYDKFLQSFVVITEANWFLNLLELFEFLQCQNYVWSKSRRNRVLNSGFWIVRTEHSNSQFSS